MVSCLPLSMKAEACILNDPEGCSCFEYTPFENIKNEIASAYRKTMAFEVPGAKSFCTESNNHVCSSMANFDCCCQVEIDAYAKCTFDELGNTFGTTNCKYSSCSSTSPLYNSEDTDLGEDIHAFLKEHMIVIIIAFASVLLVCFCAFCERKMKAAQKVKSKSMKSMTSKNIALDEYEESVLGSEEIQVITPTSVPKVIDKVPDGDKAGIMIIDSDIESDSEHHLDELEISINADGVVFCAGRRTSLGQPVYKIDEVSHEYSSVASLLEGGAASRASNEKPASTKPETFEEAENSMHTLATEGELNGSSREWKDEYFETDMTRKDENEMLMLERDRMLHEERSRTRESNMGDDDELEKLRKEKEEMSKLITNLQTDVFFLKGKSRRTSERSNRNQACPFPLKRSLYLFNMLYSLTFCCLVCFYYFSQKEITVEWRLNWFEHKKKPLY